MLCKQLRCLPSELDKEDNNKIMEWIAWNNIYSEAQEKKEKLTPKPNVRR
jgi:hypothetical protein